MSKKIADAQIKDGLAGGLQALGPEKGLASLAGGWEGSEELAERTQEFQRSRPRKEQSCVWAEEAERRAEAMEDGSEPEIPAEEVFARVRSSLR